MRIRSKKRYAFQGGLTLMACIAFIACGDDEGPGSAGTAGSSNGSEGGDASDSDTASGPGLADPTTSDGSVGDADSEDCGVIHAIIRDFEASHPDFEHALGFEAGIVEDELDDDGMPVYAHDGPTETVNGPDTFDEWYRDVEGTNQRFEITLHLESSGDGFFHYNNPEFFPIDDRGFGNHHRDSEGNLRNFHFTTEIRTTFLYEGGEVFTFTGDDDLWIFVNGRLAIDLGGVHGEMSETIDFDDMADELRIEPGETYSMDIFHAERHTSHSHFRIETNIECLQSDDSILI